MEILRKILLSKYLGLVIRHLFTAVGGFLVARGIATPEQVTGASDEAVNGVANFIASPEFQEVIGVAMVSIGGLAAATKAKIVDTKNEDKLEAVGGEPVKH